MLAAIAEGGQDHARGACAASALVCHMGNCLHRVCKLRKCLPAPRAQSSSTLAEPCAVGTCYRLQTYNSSHAYQQPRPPVEKAMNCSTPECRVRNISVRPSEWTWLGFAARSSEARQTVLERDTEEFPVSQEKATCIRIAECLDMAFTARRKADSAVGPADERFWRTMEQRWLHLGETYRETDKLRDAWLRTSAGQTAA